MVDINQRFVNTDISFWDEFPIFKTIGPFKKFYNSDKTKNKQFSSTIMWAISKVCDRSSEFYEMEYEEKIQVVFEDYLESIHTTKTKWYKDSRKELDVLISDYLNITTSKLEKALLIHENKFIERSQYLETLSYKEGDGDTIEKLLEKTSKIANELDEARKKLMSEKDKGSNKGGIETSLSDKGEI